MPRPDERPKMIQEILARAEKLLDEAAFLADEIGIEISFRGLRYIPAQIIGRWVGSEQTDWQWMLREESSWQSSNMDC